MNRSSDQGQNVKSNDRSSDLISDYKPFNDFMSENSTIHYNDKCISLQIFND